MLRNNRCFYTRNSCLFDYVKFPLIVNYKLTIRSFSSTYRREGDPLGTVAAAFTTTYAPSFLSNPLGASFIILMGLATSLFFVTGSLPGFFGQDPTYAMIIQRLDNIFLLCETFLSYEQSGIDILTANLNNFTPETLHNFYLSLQELVLVRESLFSNLSNLINSPEIEFAEGPILDRINQNFEDLRVGGNNLMGLIRILEDRLNIMEEERIPSF